MDASAALIYLFTQGITPGPSNFMSMYSSARYGLRGAKGYLIGTNLGYLIKSLLCGVLAIVLAAILPAVIPYLKWLGAAYLLYLAVHILLSSRKKAAAPEGESSAGGASFMSGILLQCLNMKSWMCCLTLFTVYVIPYDQSLGAVLTWTGIAMVIMLFSTAVWAVGGHAIQRVYARYEFPFNLLMALLLVYCAVTAVL